jgi:hypothetical protein
MGLRHPQRPIPAGDDKAMLVKARADRLGLAQSFVDLNSTDVRTASQPLESAHAAFFGPGLMERSTPPQTPQRSSRCSAVSRQTVSTGQ